MDSTELAALVMKLEPSVSVPDLRFFQAVCDAGGTYPMGADEFAALCLEMKELSDLLECAPARHDLGGLLVLLAGVARRDELRLVSVFRETDEHKAGCVPGVRLRCRVKANLDPEVRQFGFRLPPPVVSSAPLCTQPGDSLSGRRGGAWSTKRVLSRVVEAV